MDNLELLVNETGHITEEVIDDKTVRPGCLGKLKGPIAEWKDSTRNDRYYSKKLWESVFNTSWVKEALETHTLFGEADHPDDRLEPKLTKAAVVLTEYRLDDTDQTVYGSFDILDTPSGRILRTLADYGCKLGVSSRGRGKIITKNGRKTVDESSYIFGAFDVVALPSVKKAREDFVSESITDDNHKEFNESIQSQINECNSASDLMVIKNILSNLGESDNFDSLIESKLSELQKSSNNTIITGLTNDLKDAYSRINSLESKLQNSNTNTISIDENMCDLELMNSLISENASYSQVVEALKSELSMKTELVEKLKNQKPVVISKKSNDSSKISELSTKLAENIDAFNEASDQLKDTKSRLASALNSNNKLKESVSKLSDNIDALTTKNSKLTDKLDETVNDYNNLADSYNELINENSKLMNKYLDQQSLKIGISPKELIRLLPENYTVDDVDTLVKSMISSKRKLSKLPITTGSYNEGLVVNKVTDNTNHDYDNTRAILMSMKNN